MESIIQKSLSKILWFYKYQRWIDKFDLASSEIEASTVCEIDERRTPFLSVLMPVYNPSLNLLDQAIKSVRAQFYTNWELCIADDNSHNQNVRDLIKKHALADSRIRYIFREVNGHISQASNSALSLATGEFVALLDHDDLLNPYALLYVAKEIGEYPDVGLIYSDEDKLILNGIRLNPYFKSDFDYDLLLSQNAISHLGVYRTSLVRKLGGFRTGFEGSQDYDLALRMTEKLGATQIRHIPQVLYHWRIHKESASFSKKSKPYAYKNAVKAIQEHLERSKIEAVAEMSPQSSYGYRVRYALAASQQPHVELIIYSDGKKPILENNIRSLVVDTNYKNYTVTIIKDGANKRDNKFQLSDCNLGIDIKVISLNNVSKRSRAINKIILNSNAEIICILNPSISANSASWLTEMVSHSIQPGIGCVGARLWYPNKSLYSYGIVVSEKSIEDNNFLKLSREYNHAGGLLFLQKGVTAIPSDCLLVKKEDFILVGGLEEEYYHDIFCDIDFGLKLKKHGLRNVVTPYADFMLQRSNNQSKQNINNFWEQDKILLMQRWQGWINSHCDINPNLEWMLL